jgi:hypothetical protein
VKNPVLVSVVALAAPEVVAAPAADAKGGKDAKKAPAKK